MIEAGKLNNLYLKKGRLDGFSLVMWDNVTVCNSKCKLHADLCPYTKGKLCKIEVMYLKAIVTPVLDNLQDGHLTRMQWLDFGLKLVPLYNDLVRIKKALITADVLLYDRGKTIINPLFKEKREIIKCIEGLEITKDVRDKFRELGVRDPVPETPVPGDGQKEEDEAYLLKHGDSHYVAMLSAGDKDDKQG